MSSLSFSGVGFIVPPVLFLVYTRILRIGAPYHPPSRGGMIGAFFGLRPVSKTSSPLKSIYRKNHTLSLKNHKDAISTTNAAKKLERQITQAEKTIELLQEKINSLIQLVPGLLEKKKLLCSVKGIGEKIATTLIVFLPPCIH